MLSRPFVRRRKRMRLVIDTNVVVSGMFFGGRPGEFLDLLLHHRVETVATGKILVEYQATIDYLLKRYGGEHLRLSPIPLFAMMEIIPQTDHIKACRDPDDDKFISCAVDGKCPFIVSGDKDLLSLEHYNNVRILTIAQFFDLPFA